jgi:hypothetical protein
MKETPQAVTGLQNHKVAKYRDPYRLMNQKRDYEQFKIFRVEGREPRSGARVEAVIELPARSMHIWEKKKRASWLREARSTRITQ